MRWNLLALVLVSSLAGCVKATEPTPSVVSESAGFSDQLESAECWPPPMVVTQNLTMFTHGYTAMDGEGGARSYEDYVLSASADDLLRVNFSAHWDANPPYTRSIEVEFDFYEKRPIDGIHVFRGESPLLGEMEVDTSLARSGQMRLILGPRPDGPLPVWGSAVIVSQPVRFELHEVYKC